MKFAFNKSRILFYFKVCEKVQLLIIASAICFSANASNYYWVGGSGNWNDFATHWSPTSGGAQFYSDVPDSLDNVIFDANSFPQNSIINLPVNGNAYCKSFSMVGISQAVVITAGTLVAHGNVSLKSTVQINPSVSLKIAGQFNSNLHTNGSYIPVLLKESAGELSLMDNYYGEFFYINKGSLNTNSFLIDLGNTGKFTTKRDYRGNGSFKFHQSTIHCDSLFVDMLTSNLTPSYFIADSANFTIESYMYVYNTAHIKKVICPIVDLIYGTVEDLTTSKIIGTPIQTNYIYNLTMVANSNVSECGSIKGLYQIRVAHFFDTLIKFHNDIHIDSAVFSNCVGLTMDSAVVFQNLYALDIINQGASKFKINSSDTVSNIYIWSLNHLICLNNLDIKNLHVIGDYPIYAGTNSLDRGNNRSVNFTNCSFSNKLNYLVTFGTTGLFCNISEFDLSNGKLTTVGYFTNNIGTSTYGGIVQANDSKFYGCLAEGSSSIFQFNPATNTTTSMLQNVGSNVYSTMAKSSDGKRLYGYKRGAGVNSLFEYVVDSTVYRIKHNFTVGNDAYGTPCISNDKIYGTLGNGGTTNSGVLFEYDITNNTETAKYEFAVPSGAFPRSGLIQAANNKLYGTTSVGGTFGKGTIFEFDLVADTLKHFFNFNSFYLGSLSNSELIEGTGGKLYGLAARGGIYNHGAIYEIDTATHTVLEVASFDSLVNGANPTGALLLSSSGWIRGFTRAGGNNGYGTIFEFNPITHELFASHHLNGNISEPVGKLVEIDAFPLSIQSQPTNVLYCNGGSAQFEITVRGSGTINYVWQDSTATHNWQNITNSNLSYINLYNIPLANTGNKYRCIVSTPLDTVISNAASLLLNPNAFKVILPATVPVCDNLNSICPAYSGGSPDVYYWEDIFTSCRTFLNSGTFIFHAITIDGCKSSDTIVVGTGSPILMSGAVTASTCGMCDGSVAINVTGASAPYFITPVNLPGPNLSALCEGESVNLICTDQNSCVGNYQFVMPYACNGDVWPGDANVDFTANNFDLLPIGLAYGATGTTRQNASLAWVGQYSADWLQTQLNGADYKHIDGNGDGLIDAADTLPIILNYGYVHPRQSLVETNSTAPFLYFTYVNDTVMAGDTLLFEIGLGTVILPADSVYGIAFTINYSKEVVDSNSAHISHAQCWMGTPNLNLLTLQHDNYTNGKIDCAIVGTDHLNKQGFGTIGILGIDMKDDLSGRDSLIKTLNLSFSNLRFIDSDGIEKPLNVINDSIIVWQDITKLQEYTMQHNSYSVYPNPASNFVTLDLSKLKQQVTEVSLVNMYGVEVYSTSNLQDGKLQVSTKKLNAGVYSVQVKTVHSILSKKLIITTGIH